MKCQKADWGSHRFACWQFQSFQKRDRPTPNHVRGVIFPVYPPRPRYIWLLKENKYDRDTSKYLGDRKYQEKRGWRNFACRVRDVHTQQLYFYSLDTTSPFYNQQPLNECIPALAVTKGLSFPWHGPVVVTGECRDVNVRDYRAAVDFLLAYPMNMGLMDPSRYQGMAIEGVKVNCDHATAHFGVERLQPIELTEEMMDKNSPVRLHIFPSLPLVVRSAPPIGKAKRAHNPYYMIPVLEERLFGAKSPGMVKLDELNALRRAQCRVGTLVLHRADRKPLFPVHVEALERFVQEKVQSAADSEGNVRRESIAFLLKREDFDAFWLVFVEELAGFNMPVPPSPFEM